MAEALAIASSIAGLLSLTIQIVEFGSTFTSDYNNAPKFGKAYLAEVELLMQTLKSLKARIDDQDIRTFLLQQIPNDHVPAFATAGDCLKSCTEELQAVRESLLRYKATQVPSWDRLKWHFNKSDLRADVERLQRYRTMILDDFENAISSRTVQGIKSILESQSRISDSIGRAEQGNVALRFSSEELDAKLQSFRQDITSLRRDTMNLAGAVDRLTLKHEDTYNVIQRVDEQQDLLKNIGQTNTRQNKDIIRASEASSQLEILEWLSDVDPSSNHDIARRMHEPETGSWLIKHADFLNWRDNVGKMMWLHGIAGSGKTVLCSTVIESLIDYLKTSQIDRDLAYFYFDFRAREKLTCNGMLRSLLRQLLSLRPVLPESIQNLFEQSKRKGHQLQQAQLLEALCQVINDSGGTYLVIDAVDECPMREDLAILIMDLFEKAKLKVNVFITSREEFDIEEALSEIQLDEILQVDVELQTVQPDIENFIRSRLSKDRKLRKWTDHKSHLLDVLCHKAGGMFRWVVCQLEALGKCRTVPELEDCLLSLPKTLEATYERILAEICEEDMPRAIRALQWLAFNREPDSELSLEVLAEASAAKAIGPFDVRDRLRDPREILSVLSALVSTCRNESGITMVFLAHYSVKEYLESVGIRHSLFKDFAISEYPSHVNIAGACLQYLLQFDQEVAAGGTTSDKFPLMLYAAEYWPSHAHNVLPRITVRPLEKSARNEGDYVEELILDLLNTQNAAFWNWVGTRWRDNRSRQALKYPDVLVSLSTLPLPTPFAAALNLPSVLKKLIERGEQLDAVDCDSATPLQIGAQCGFEEVVRILLENGADVDRKSVEWPVTPLHLAISGGFNNIANLLLDFGARVDHDFFRGLRPTANIRTVDRLLKQALVENGATTLETALLSAADLNLCDFGRLLLSKQVDVNCGKPDTPLIKATRTESRRFVLLLLQYEADLDVMGEEGTALMIAAGLGYAQLAELLLDFGANMELVHHEKGTALISAASEGQHDLVELLLDRGANPRARRPDLSNALLMALLNRHNSVVEELWNHPNAFPSALEQVQYAMWAAVAHHCRQQDKATLPYKEALWGMIDLGVLAGLLEYPASKMPEDTDVPEASMLQAWILWTLLYIGPEGCGPAMYLAVETDDGDALALLNDYGASIEGSIS